MRVLKVITEIGSIGSMVMAMYFVLHGAWGPAALFAIIAIGLDLQGRRTW